jgi:hypothetical protein
MLDVDDLIIECAITPFSSYTFISSSTDPTIELQIDLKGHFILPEVLPTFILSPRNSTWMLNYVALRLIGLIQY